MEREKSQARKKKIKRLNRVNKVKVFLSLYKVLEIQATG